MARRRHQGFHRISAACAEIEARACEKEKTSGDDGGERPPMEFVRVTAFLQAEEFKVVNEMEDGHADESRAPEEVDERDARNRARRGWRATCAFPSCPGLLSSSPRHESGSPSLSRMAKVCTGRLSRKSHRKKYTQENNRRVPSGRPSKTLVRNPGQVLGCYSAPDFDASSAP